MFVITDEDHDGPVRLHSRTNLRSVSEPQREGGRDTSAESGNSSHHSNHHSSYPATKYMANREHGRSISANSPHSTHTTIDKPEHLVYDNRPVEEANWIISPKPREHRYTQRKARHTNQNSSQIYGRSRSEERYEYRPHQGPILREISVPSGGVSRYVSNRSRTAPHRNTIQRVHHEDNVIRAIQMGVEKRQRAVRLSLYQMADPVDYEWEI